MSADLTPIFKLAQQQHQAGRMAEAEAIYRDILGRDPDHVGALGELGRLAFQLGRPEVSRALLAHAVGLVPQDPALHNNLAIAQEHSGQLDAALASHRHNLALHPAYPDALNNLGNVLVATNALDAGIRAYRRAVAVAPTYWQAINNLGVALHRVQRDAEAVDAYRQALGHHDDPDLHHNLSHALLAQGRLGEAWPEYEWRSRTPQHATTWPRLAQPRWQGGVSRGQAILIHTEQGLGDAVQFCRYVPMVSGRGLAVVLQVQAPLVRLMSRLDGVTAVVSREDGGLPAFDLQCPMLSLPGAFGTTLETIPNVVPYLSADPADMAGWAGRLGVAAGRARVGLSWAGNPRLPADIRRSVPVGALVALLECPDIAFYSLQKNGVPPPGAIDLMAQVHDLADTAALIANLDLVISVDSVVAHLAGALGKPVWLLNRYDSEWRWLRHRDDSPWYPTLRQFRQAAPGDWDGVIARVRAELARMGDPTSSHWQNDAGCSI